MFSIVCNQGAAHTWAPGGALLPCCQRCTGLYVGAAVAMLLWGTLRLQPGARCLQLHGLLLAQMVPLGLHWIPQDAALRTASGVLFGFGLVPFLWLAPSRVLCLQQDWKPWKTRFYIAALTLGALLLPMLAECGGGGVALLLTWLAACGLVALATATVAALGMGIVSLLVAKYTGNCKKHEGDSEVYQR